MGFNIRDARKRLKMSQEELADKSGVSRVTISAIETGSVKNAEINTIIKIADALGVTIGELFYADS